MPLCCPVCIATPITNFIIYSLSGSALLGGGSGLDRNSGGGNVAIFIGAGTLPTLYRYYKAEESSDLNHVIYLRNPPEQTYIVGIYGVTTGSHSFNITVTTEFVLL